MTRREYAAIEATQSRAAKNDNRLWRRRAYVTLHPLMRNMDAAAFRMRLDRISASDAVRAYADGKRKALFDATPRHLVAMYV